MSDMDLKAFPESFFESMAVRYLQNQNLKGKTQLDICGMYGNAIHHCNRGFKWMNKEVNLWKILILTAAFYS